MHDNAEPINRFICLSAHFVALLELFIAAHIFLLRQTRKNPNGKARNVMAMNSQWIEQALPKQSHRAERLFSFPFAIRCGFGFSFCRIENVLETDCGVVDITQRAIGVAETPCGSFDIVLFSCFCFPYSFYQFSKEGLMVECTARVQH